MLSITNYLRNAKQNYNELSLHTVQNDHHQKKKKKEIHKQFMLDRVWRKGNPPTLLLGMKISASTVENIMEVP